jgi:hypothetical protein
LEILECPSHADAGEEKTNAPGTASNYYSLNKARRTSYLFNTGSMTDYSERFEYYNGDIRQGAFGNNGAATFAHITDGTSNSIAIGEANGGRMKTYTYFGPWGLNGAHTCCHGYTPSNSSTTIAPAASHYDFNINHPYQGDVLRRHYAWVFGSFHPGGAQFVLCDGSTRYVSQTIDYINFCRLNYIHDGQPLAPF